MTGRFFSSRRSGTGTPEPPLAGQSRSRERIRQLQTLSRKGLWGFAAFLLISLGALAGASFLPPLPAHIRQTLGSAPPTNLISIALVVYSFSALVLILSRMSSGSGTYRGWSHLAYLGAFYGFYYYAKALEANFWAIFTAGITVMALEHYHIWSYCAENIRKEQERISRLERQNPLRE